jgi:alanine racemase
MPQYTISQLAVITGGKLVGLETIVIDTIETDSRRINTSPGSIFVAIKGLRHDGHFFIKDLYQSGIKNFLVQNIPEEAKNLEGVNYLIVKDSIFALQALASYYRKELSMPLVAITGSNGKTVVKEWLFQSLSQKFTVSRSPKSYNSQIGVPLSIWMLKSSAEWAIIEAGISMPGEMAKLEKVISPDFGIITNIGQAHQENFESIERKVSEKLVLFRNSKVIYYCRDHEIIHQKINNIRIPASQKLVSWSNIHKDSFLYISHRSNQTNATEIEARVGLQKYQLKIPFTDEASVENCMHIVTFLFHQEFTAEFIQHAISQLVPVAMRLEQVKGSNNCTLINDSYNSDINSLKIALDFLALQKQHKKHTVILSDLKQSGLKPDELYKEVIGLIKSYPIDKFIAIGAEITSFAQLPEETRKFNGTKEFLASLNENIFSNQAILIKGAREFRFEEIVKALSDKKHTTILEINLNNLVYNLNYFRGLLKPETKIMVMVKALSYGSGSFEIANLLQHEKVDYLGVAYTDEGIDLRNNGISLPIMVMSPTNETFLDIIEYSLEPEIYSFTTLKEFSRVVSSSQLAEYPIHLKLDTGMHRLGFMPEDIPQLLNLFNELKNIRIKAVFSHLAVADNELEDDFTQMQIDQFEEMYAAISQKLGYLPMRHILNSAGIERFPKAHFEMVRLGIGLHGISINNADLKPVSRLKSRISQIKHLGASETIGYNRSGKLKSDSVIAIIPIGYADGLDRKLGNHNGYVIVNNQKADFIGDICMDMCMIDITGIKATEGDEIIIFGEENPITNLSKQIGTIPYEILTNITSRVKRVYLNE